MEITLAVLADASNVSRENKLNILGAFNRINARVFPAIHPSMQLVMRFECSPAELGQTKSLQVVMLDADGKRLGAVEGQMVLPDNIEVGQRLQIDESLALQNTRFEAPGIYEISVLVDGDEKATIPLTVVQVETEPPTNG